MKSLLAGDYTQWLKSIDPVCSVTTTVKPDLGSNTLLACRLANAIVKLGQILSVHLSSFIRVYNSSIGVIA